MATHSAQTNPAARHSTSSVWTMMRWLGAGTAQHRLEPQSEARRLQGARARAAAVPQSMCVFSASSSMSAVSSIGMSPCRRRSTIRFA